jgi:hypothetical protein
MSVVLPDAFECAGSAARMRETRVCCGDGIKLHARSGIAARELPEKTIVKNCASLVTYPHSECKRLENRSGPEQT